MDFRTAHKFTAKWEKGLVDHPRDPGGITKDGISIRFLESYAGSNTAWLQSIGVQLPVVPDTIRTLNTEQIDAIFERAFWLPLRPETFPPITMLTLYDCSVNSGQGRAIRCLQEACNLFDGEKLNVDGAVGPKTRARAMEIGNRGLDFELALKSVGFRETFLRSLSTFDAFGKGWMNRLEDLRSELRKLSQQVIVIPPAQVPSAETETLTIVRMELLRLVAIIDAELAKRQTQ